MRRHHADGLTTMGDLYKVISGNGKPLAPGVRVQVYGFDPENEAHLRGEHQGVVESISDPDGDVNDYGRPVAILPRVVVRFDDGSADSFVAQWTARGPGDEDAPYECEDLVGV